MACILNKTPVLYRAAYYRNIIFSPVFKVTCVKNYGYFSPNKSDVIVEKRFKLKDNITDDYKLIYREHNTIHKTIVFSYYSGWFCLLFGICITGYMIIEKPPLKTEEIKGLFTSVQPESKVSRILIMISSVLLPIMLIYVIRMMPFRIYYSSSQKLYKAIFIKDIWRKESIEIFGENSAIPLFSRFKILEDTIFKINGRSILLDRYCFAVQATREKMIFRAK